jgi:perosamine synthetase
MKLSDRIRLIPRNNWDYGVKAFLSSLAAVRRDTAHAPNIEAIFQQKPVWTRSGRASLYAILKALELPVGAKVAVPLFCCPVVFNTICQAGLSPCFIDSNINDFTISVEDLHKKRSDLAGIVAVHMFGYPYDIEAIAAAAGPIPVIEDCALSLFSTYKGRLTGRLSTASFFSFRCGKYISAGEGSAIFCEDPEIYKKIEQVANSFESWSTRDLVVDSLLTFIKATLYHRPWYGLLGYPVGMRLDKNLNLTAKDGFQAGKIASTHLALIDARIARFQEKIKIQTEHARMLLDAVVPTAFSLPSESNGTSVNWSQFAIRFENPNHRDAMADYLFDHGIDASKYADSVPEEARSNYGYRGDCPYAELLSKTLLLVPIHYTLSTGDMEYIARTINAASKAI